MAENYIAYNLESNDEVLMALLSQYPFASFEELDEGMIGYISEADHDDETIAGIASICKDRDVVFSTNIIEPQNWNAQWEASFQPVEVRKFCRIRADFHPQVEGFEHDIVINPKMAFGTGHHETTWMMIDAMSKIDFSNKSVLDFGAGTGVLAILAEKLGSKHNDAIDIEEESYLNTIENAEINNCARVASYEGELPRLADNTYDIILANINRHVLLTTADQLFTMVRDQGTLLLSGILSTDETLIVECYKTAGFDLVDVASRGNWRCIQLKKNV